MALVLFAALVVAERTSRASMSGPLRGPRTANVYIRNYYEPGDAEKLSRYDIVALDADTPPEIVQEIRSFNTGTKILAFIPSNGTYMSAMLFPDGSIWRELYETAETHNWWLRNTVGGQISDHGGKWTTNITEVCPKNSLGMGILDWYPIFIVYTLLGNGNGVWDGVYFDDCWVGINWVTIDTVLNPYPIDANLDGIADPAAQIDGWWKAGTDTLVSRVRRMLPPDMMVMGNGQNHFYTMNGAMIENFPFTGYPEPTCPYHYSWDWDMFGNYGYFNNEAGYNPNPARINIINTKWIYGDRYDPVRSSDFERLKRFTLVSCMLGNGYYSLDWFDLPGNKKAHHSLWWEAEYDKPIGNPIGPAYQVNHEGVTIWRRDFENGSVVINPTASSFPPALADSLPFLDAWDAQIILNGEFYAPDLTPPARVTDLRVTQIWADSVEVEWTNAGDDGMVGSAGAVTIRYKASAVLDNSNFLTGKRLLPGVYPDSAGTTQRARIGGLTLGQLYYVALRHTDDEGNSANVSNNAFFVAGNTVSDVPPRPDVDRITLSTPWPNPFVDRIGAALQVPRQGVTTARVSVLDAAGRRVRLLVNGPLPGGPQRLDWDGATDLGAPAPAGVYFWLLETDTTRDVRKIVKSR